MNCKRRSPPELHPKPESNQIPEPVPYLIQQIKLACARVTAENTYDWTGDQFTIPINLAVRKMFKIGDLDAQWELGGRYYADKGDLGPDWGLRATMTLLFHVKCSSCGVLHLEARCLVGNGIPKNGAHSRHC